MGGRFWRVNKKKPGGLVSTLCGYSFVHSDVSRSSCLVARRSRIDDGDFGRPFRDFAHFCKHFCSVFIVNRFRATGLPKDAQCKLCVHSFAIIAYIDASGQVVSSQGHTEN